MTFCSNCGARLEEGAKFCKECGTPIAAAKPAEQVNQPMGQAPQPVTVPPSYAQPASPVPQSSHAQASAPVPQPNYPQSAASVPQPNYPAQPAPMQPPPYQMHANQSFAPMPPAPKKKSKLPIILGVLGIVVVGIVATVFLIFNGVMSALNETAKAEYYEIGGEKIPSVRLVLGEERKVTGISNSVSGSAKITEIKYEVPGSEQSKEMSNYITYLHDKEGFLYATDIDFNKAESNGVLARNSTDKGYELLVQVKYDRQGYTITLVKQEGGVTPFNSTSSTTASTSSTVASSASVTPSTSSTTTSVAGNTSQTSKTEPWVALWRSEGDDGVEILHLKADNSFLLEGYYTDGTENLSITGKYVISGDYVKFIEVMIDGKKQDDSVFAFEVIGDTAMVDEKPFYRVPDKDVQTVLKDPEAPYPAGSSNTGIASGTNSGNSGKKSVSITPATNWKLNSEVNHLNYACTDSDRDSADIAIHIVEKSSENEARDYVNDAYDSQKSRIGSQQDFTGGNFGEIKSTTVNGYAAKEYSFTYTYTGYGLTLKYQQREIFIHQGVYVYYIVCNALVDEWDAVTSDYQKMINSFALK